MQQGPAGLPERTRRMRAGIDAAAFKWTSHNQPVEHHNPMEPHASKAVEYLPTAT